MEVNPHLPIWIGLSSISNSAVAARDPFCLCELTAKAMAAKIYMKTHA